MKTLFLAIAVTFCLTLFFSVPASRAADNPQTVDEQVAALNQQIAQLQTQIDALRALKDGQTATLAPLAISVSADACAQASAGSCGAAASGRSAVRVGARSGERRGLFGRLRARRGGC